MKITLSLFVFAAVAALAICQIEEPHCTHYSHCTCNTDESRVCAFGECFCFPKGETHPHIAIHTCTSDTDCSGYDCGTHHGESAYCHHNNAVFGNVCSCR